MNILYHNGKFIDEAPVFSPRSRIRLGDGVFDTMLALVTTEGTAVLICADLHFSRLLQDAALMGIDTTDLFDKMQAEEIALELFAKNSIQPGRYALNTIITRGDGLRGLAVPEHQHPTLSMMISPVPDDFPPVRAVISKTVRRNEGSPLSQIKSCNYGDNILALQEAESKGANEVILLNNSGLVTCASAGNIFAVLDGQLTTPPLSDGAMNGITRALVIEKYGAQERSITAKDLRRAYGIYLTNSIRGVLPVVSLDGKFSHIPFLKIPQYFHLD